MRGPSLGRRLILATLIAVATGAELATTSWAAAANPSTASRSVHPRSGFGHVMSGYWQVQADGQVFPYGDTVDYTPEPPPALNQPMVGGARTADGGGYWLVASDGGVFSYGDAPFYGSAARTVLHKPVVGMAATLDGHGYWLVASDGGVFSYGDAPFYGSAAKTVLNKPVVGMAASSNGGYYLTAADGGLFAFGGAEFDGSGANQPPYQYPYATVAVLSQSPPLGAIAAGTPFAGLRYHHGVLLLVGDDGRFAIQFRTYNNVDYPGTRVCGDARGCDLFVNSLIIDGGHAGGRITSIAGNSASTVVSYDPSGFFSTGTPTMSYDPSTDEVTFSGVAFCGSNTPTPNDCGA